MLDSDGYFVRKPGPRRECDMSSSTDYITALGEDARGTKRLRSLTVSGASDLQQALGDPRCRSPHQRHWNHREHNRLAHIIKSETGETDDDTLYEQARRILIAEMQTVVYGGYLPVVLGRDNLDGLRHG